MECHSKPDETKQILKEFALSGQQDNSHHFWRCESLNVSARGKKCYNILKSYLAKMVVSPLLWNILQQALGCGSAARNTNTTKTIHYDNKKSGRYRLRQFCCRESMLTMEKLTHNYRNSCVLKKDKVFPEDIDSYLKIFSGVMESKVLLCRRNKNEE